MKVDMINKNGNAIMTATTAAERQRLESLGFTVFGEEPKEAKGEEPKAAKGK